MKIGLITPANIWKCPFVKIYTKILENKGVEYDLISWNKDGCENQEIQYNERCEAGRGIYNFMAYYKFARFVKRILREKKYEKLIVFSPQLAIFINSFLVNHYKGRYIFDYRDLSIEQKPYFRYSFKKVLRNSFANVISSPGFKKCLPKEFSYYLSHNFNVDVVKESLGKVNQSQIIDKKISILTIGAIRDYSSNIEVIKSLANKADFSLSFVGKGGDAELIKKFADENGVTNIHFEGYYPKEKEAEYILKSTFLNIFYPRIITHDTALSNRFYNSLIYRKPMIVTKGTTQGDFVEKFNVGVAVSDCSNLEFELKNFIMSDYQAYAQRCDKLLLEFMRDQYEFERMIEQFLVK